MPHLDDSNPSPPIGVVELIHGTIILLRVLMSSEIKVFDVVLLPLEGWIELMIFKSKPMTQDNYVGYIRCPLSWKNDLIRILKQSEKDFSVGGAI